MSEDDGEYYFDRMTELKDTIDEMEGLMDDFWEELPESYIYHIQSRFRNAKKVLEK